MKTLYMIGGAMGVGKTTVCQALKRELPRSVFLDGDWCWDAHPFQVTPETKQMVLENICFLLNSFIRCSAYETVLFCWVLHEQAIIDSILERLDAENCRIVCVSLLAGADTLSGRLKGDMEKGIRGADALERSLARMPLYETLDTIKINTDGKTVSMLAEEIKALS